MTQLQLAQKLKISFQVYQRMDRPRKANLTINTLNKIATALDGDFIFDLKKTA
ncbi:MAG: helix-turn-helix transcriptional regulator [Bacteriovoracaceae bacterium]|nr:helix-turn-helix transcriptional regulator [Bacteriovoracaceae bacterium]